MIAGFAVFFFFLSVDNGSFRFYMITGIALGALIYTILPGRIIVSAVSSFLCKIMEFFRKLLKKTVNKHKINRKPKKKKAGGGSIEKG